MARTPPVTVPFVGEDGVSSVLQGIVARGVMMGNVLTKGLEMVGNAATSVFNTMRSQFDTAANTQMSFIGTAGALMGVLNVGFDDALTTTKELNAEFVALGSRLPGTAADFAMIGASVSDDIFNAFRHADGTVDMPKAKSTLLELTEGWGLLANQSMTTVQEASQNLIRLLGGDVNALKMAQFDKSPAFKNALDRVLEADGKTRKDWEKSTTAQRAEWLNKAVGMTIPPEAVEAMSQTIEGVVNGWKSRLFDPTSGMIGFLRELSNREGATIMQGLEGIVNSGDKMLRAIINIWPFKFDVLEPLYDSLVWIRRQIDRATALLAPDDAVAGLQSGTKALSKAIGASLQSAFRRVTIGVHDISSVLSKIDFTVVFSSIVNRVTSAMANMGIDLGSLDFSSIGSALGGYMSNVRGMMQGLMKNAFTGLIRLFNTIARVISDIPISTGAIAGLGIGSLIGEAIGSSIGFVLSRMVQFIGTIDLASVLVGMVKLLPIIAGAMIGLTRGLFMGLANFAPELESGLRQVMSNALGNLAFIFTPLTATIKAILTPIIFIGKGLVSLMGAILSPIALIGSSILGAVGKILGALGTVFRGILGATVSGVANIMGEIIGVWVKVLSPVAGLIFDTALNLAIILGKIFTPVLEALTKILGVTVSVLSNILSVVSSILGAVGRVILTILGGITLIGVTIAKGIAGIVIFIGKAILALPQLIASLFDSLGDGISGIILSLGSLTNKAIGFVTSGIASVISGIGDGLGRMSKSAVDAITSTVARVASSIGSMADPVLSAIRGIFDGVTQTFSRIQSSLSSMMPSMPSMPSISGIASGIGSAVQSGVSAITGSTPAPSSSPSVDSEMAALRTQHNAGGNLSPLLHSIRAEKRAMPSGSNLVIANSSEAILNRQQTRSLASMMVSGNRSQSAQNPHLTATININGVTDPNAVADAVLSRLDAVWGLA